MKVAISDRAENDVRTLEDLVVFLRTAGERMGISDGLELSLVLVREEEMSDLNREYMNREGETDVLAFPLMEAEELKSVCEEKVHDLLGDVVICTEVARSQAVALGHGYEDEVAFLAVHGLLHLLGYSHDDKGKSRDMRAKEDELFELWIGNKNRRHDF